jgi:hypothetical protein
MNWYQSGPKAHPPVGNSSNGAEMMNNQILGGKHRFQTKKNTSYYNNYAYLEINYT